MSDGAKLRQDMLDGGAPALQVEEWERGLRQKMLEGGAPPKDVAKYWGDKDPDAFKGQLSDHINASMDALQGHERAKVAEDPVEMFKAGLQISSAGLAVHGKPTTVAPEHSGMLGNILYQSGMMLGDIPAMVAGYATGKAVSGLLGPVGKVPIVSESLAGYGMGALPEAIRGMLMDQYEHPDGAKSWSEFWERMAPIAIKTNQAGVVGAISNVLGGQAGYIAGKLTGSALTSTGAKLGTMAVSATAVGSALEGKVPSAEDYAIGAIMALGFHVAGSTVGATQRFVMSERGENMAQNLRDIYRRTGIGPKDAVELAVGDPALRTELLGPRAASGNYVTPALDALKPAEPEPYSKREPGVKAESTDSVANMHPADTRSLAVHDEHDPLLEDAKTVARIDRKWAEWEASGEYDSHAWAERMDWEREKARDKKRSVPTIVDNDEKPPVKAFSNPHEMKSEDSSDPTLVRLNKNIRDKEKARDALVDQAHGTSDETMASKLFDKAEKINDAITNDHAEIEKHLTTPRVQNELGVPDHVVATVRDIVGQDDFGIRQMVAKDHGFDPEQLKDPMQAERIFRTIWAGLDKEFNGNFIDMLVAFHQWPITARRWIESGRHFLDLPLETQQMLQRAEHEGVFNAGFNEGQAIRQLEAQGDSAQSLRPQSRHKVTPLWTIWGENSTELVTRRLENGHVVPDPHAVASYLKKFAEVAGFRFQVGPAEPDPYAMPGSYTTRSTNTAGAHFADESYSVGKELPVSARHVYIPDTDSELTRRWWGLGRNEIIFHEVGHALYTHLSSFPEIASKEQLEAWQKFKQDNPQKATQFGTKPRLRKPMPDYELPDGPFKEELVEASKKFRPKLWETQPEYNAKTSELMADAIAAWLSDPTVRDSMPLFGKKYGKSLKPFVDIAEQNLPRKTENGWEMPGQDGASAEYDNLMAGRTGGGYRGSNRPPHIGRNEPEVGSPEHKKKIETTRMQLTEDERVQKIVAIVAPEVKSGILPDWLNPMLLWRSFQSQLTPARVVDRTLRAEGTLKAGQMGVEDMLRQTFGSAGRANEFYTHGVVDAATLEQISDASFKGAHEAVVADGGDRIGFLAYRLAARTVEKARQGIETGVDVKLSELHLADPNVVAKYERGAAIMREAKDGSIDYLRDSGVLSDVEARIMKIANREHIVFRRLMEPDYNPPRPGRAFGVRQPLKVMKGSKRAIVDPETADVDNLVTIIAMADRNKAWLNVTGAIEAHNAKQPKQIEDGTRIPFYNITEQLAGSDPRSATVESTAKAGRGELLDENGAVIPDQIEKGLAPFLASKQIEGRLGRKLGPDDFVVFRDGKAEVWHSEDPYLSAAMRVMNQGKTDPLPKLLTMFGRWQRAGITSALDFPFRSIMHGQFAATVAAEGGQRIPYHDVMIGIMSAWKQDGAWERWARNGGAGVALADIDRLYLSTNIDKIYEQTGTAMAVLNAVRHPIEALRMASHLTDHAARVGFMIRNERQGIDSLRAATLSRKAYLDHAEGFSANWVNTWARMTAFMPVGFKDIEQVTQAFRDRPLGILMKGATILTAPTVLNFAANIVYDELAGTPENDKYLNLPDWEREMYWVLPPVNGVRLKIKKPYVMGWWFSTMPEKMLKWTVSQEADGLHSWAKSLMEQTMPPFMPAFLAPIAEQYANKSFFTGRPIVKKSLEHASGFMQYEPDTSLTAKKLAQVMGPPGMNMVDASPLVIQNYIREWGGTLPFTLLKIMERPFSSNNKAREIADMPFVGSFFVRQPRGGQALEDFYTALHGIQAAHRNLKLAIEQKDQALIDKLNTDAAHFKYSELEKAMAGHLSVIKGIDSVPIISETQAKARDINIANSQVAADNPGMTNAEKRKYVDSILVGVMAIAKQGMETMRAAQHGHSKPEEIDTQAKENVRGRTIPIPQR